MLFFGKDDDVYFYDIDEKPKFINNVSFTNRILE